MPRKKKEEATETTTIAVAGELTDNNILKKYTKLAGVVDYDHEAAEQLAAALNEVTIKENEIASLRQLISENEELHQFVWRTSDNVVLALHQIDDDHLANIMMHTLRKGGGAISKAIRSEALRRNIVVPQRVSIDWDNISTKQLLDVQRGLSELKVNKRDFNRGEEW